MKSTEHNIGYLLIIAIIVFSSLFGLPGKTTIASAQTARQLPTRIQINDTPADITISVGASRMVATGDFNGDGVDDFLVQYNKVVGEYTQNIVFVKFGIIFGQRNQNRPISIDLSTDEPDLSLTIGVSGAFAFQYVAELGDLNGDGVDDIVLTQQLAGELGQPGDTILKVFLGSSRFQPGVIDLNTLQPDLKIIADRRVFNTGIAGVADVNADGVKDLLLTENSSYMSALPILFGPFTAGETIDLSAQEPDVIIRANNRVDNINSVYLADVNGDRITDLLIMKSRFDDRSGLYFTALDVVFGSEDLSSGTEISLSDGEADATVTVGFNFFVIATGDINGDGIDDILTGNPVYDGEPAPPHWFAGNVSVILGSRSMQGTVNQTDAFIAGLPAPETLKPVYQISLGDLLGWSLAVGDINGDGISDILIGAPGLTNDRKGRVTSLGRAHIVLGSTEIKRGTRVETGREQQDIKISFDSKTRGGGGRVGSGDFNGDGVSDILVGSDSAIYVFFGAELRPPEITKAKYRKSLSQLSIFGSDFTGSARVEINGVVIDREVTFEPDNNSLVLRGLESELNLRHGKNDVVVIRKGARSNAVRLKV